MLVGYPPSPQQLRRFRLAEGGRGDTFRARCRMRLRGAVDPGSLAAALARVVARQPILRTRLERLPGMRLPVQVEDPAAGGPFPLVQIDLGDLAAPVQDAALAALWHLPRPAGAPFSVRLLTLSAAEAALDLDLAPWTADEATLDLLAGEIAAAWAALLGGGSDSGAAGEGEAADVATVGKPAEQASPGDDDGEESPFQYAQYAAWRNGLAEDDEAAEGRAFWEGLRLRDTPRLALPADSQGIEPGAFAPRRTARHLPAAPARRLREAADALGVSLEIVLLAVWHALLFRWTGRSEGLTGRLVSGREHELLARVLGPLAEVLPVWVSLASDLPFADLARRLAALCEEAAAWQEHFRLEDAVAAAAPGEEPEGFPVIFAWRGTPPATAPVLAPSASPAGAPTLPPASVPAAGDSTPSAPAVAAALPAAPALQALPEMTVECRRALAERCDLLLQAAEDGDGIALELIYNSGRYTCAAADRLLAQFEALAASAASAPAALVTPLAQLALVPPAELAAVTATLRGPQREPPENLRPLHRLFEEQAARTPDRVAVAWGDEALTYAELDARANRLARHLRAAGLGPEQPAGLLLDRSPELIVALWAVLKAGGACLPLDPLHPPARLLAMVEAAGARLVLSRGALAATTTSNERDERRAPGDAAGTPCRIVDLDIEQAVIAQQLATPLPDGGAAGNLAYVIFTSGTSGQPKGVMVEHRSVANLLGALRRTIYDFHAVPDRPLVVGLNAPFVFDASVKQWIQLLAGHTLRLVPEEVRPDGAALAAFVRATGIDALDCTPSTLRGLLAAGFAAAEEPGPRIVLVGGEAIDAATWRRLAELEEVGPALFLNVYGPTECTVDATARWIGGGAKAAAAPPMPTLGRPLPGVHAAIVDPREPGSSELEPVPHGAAGELLIGGAGVARGYLKQPELTALRFVPDPSAAAGPGTRLYRSGDLVRLTEAGEIEFLGRRDHQVKVRGFRIELEEVEAALLAEPAVRQAAVRRFEEAGEARLVAYVALRGTAGAGTGAGVTAADAGTATGASSAPAPGTTEGDLRAALRRRLPEFMVPAQIVMLRDLPLTASGKLDRAALPPPERVRPARAPFVAAASAAERTVAAVWAEVLGVERVGRDDNFFDLGGHSLLMVRAHGRLQEAFGRPLSMVEMFRLPTVAALAAHLVHGGPAPLPATSPASPIPPESATFSAAPAVPATVTAPSAPAALTAAQQRGARQREEQERQRQAARAARSQEGR